MFARFDENPAMTFQDIKKNKALRTDAHTDGQTDRQREKSIPTTNKVCGGYNYQSNWLLIGTGIPFSVRSCYNKITFFTFFILDTLANSEDPDEMPHHAAFHQGLCFFCLWINVPFNS